MAAPNGSTRGRVASIAGGVLVVALLAGLWQWGDGAVKLDEGALVTTSTSARGAWASFAVHNDSDFPVTLKEFRPGTVDNVQIVRTVVIRPPRDEAWHLQKAPLDADRQAVVDAGRAVDGFVVPANSDVDEVAVLFRPVRATRTASIDGGIVVYSSITGIGHSARGGLQVCLRASSGACPSAD